MAKDTKLSDSSYVLFVILVYTILGPLGITPAAIGIVGLLLARNTPFVDFVVAEYEAYHDKRERQRFEHVRSQITEDIRRHLSLQHDTEHAGSKAQIRILTEELRAQRDDFQHTTKTYTDANEALKLMRNEREKLRTELQSLKTKLETLEKKYDAQQAASNASKPAIAPVSALKPTTNTLFGGLLPLTSQASEGAPSQPTKATFGTTGTVIPKQSSVFDIPLPSRTPKVEARPQIQPLKIELPSELARLNPARPGFTCIGRAIATHGGPCRSYSDDFLPKSRLRQAATILDTMQSTTSGSEFEIQALRDLADMMLCIHHGRGCKYDQVTPIALNWYNALAPSREQLRKRKEAVTPVRKLDDRSPPGTAGSFGSRPISPASSAGESVSTAATTPDVSDGRNTKTAPVADKPSPFLFSAGHTAVFGSPSPAPKVNFGV